MLNQIEIKNLKAIRIDDLQEKYKITKRSRIERFGTVLSKVQEELEKRDLSNVPTEKLINLYLTGIKGVREEKNKALFLEG